MFSALDDESDSDSSESSVSVVQEKPLTPESPSSEDEEIQTLSDVESEISEALSEQDDDELDTVRSFDDLEGRIFFGANPISKVFVDAIKGTIPNITETTVPTDVQTKCWSIFSNEGLKHRNVIAIARTGAGKTLAFLVPALSLLSGQVKVREAPAIAVIAPTRELSEQIFQVAQKISLLGVAVSLVVGGIGFSDQVQKLKESPPDMIIGTVGRILSLCNVVPESTKIRNSNIETIGEECLNLKQLQLLVLDEGDRLLDMGFANDLIQLYRLLDPPVQVILTSATWTQKTTNDVTDLFLGQPGGPKGPLFVSLEDAGMAASRSVKQTVEVVKEKGAHRFHRLVAVLDDMFKLNSKARVFVFVMHKMEAKDIAKQLQASTSHSAVAFQGDMSQKARFEAIHLFRTGKVDIVVATDVASRGIDIKGVTNVVNYSFGMSVESYIHRIGRCGRNGTFGHAHTFITRGDDKYVPALVDILNESKQFVNDDLRILCNKMTSKKKPKDLSEDEIERLQLQQENREKQMRSNKTKRINGGKQKRRGK